MSRCKYVCIICEKEYDSNFGIKRHLSSKVHENDLKDLNTDITTLYYEKPTEKMLFSCNICGKTFDKKAYLDSHSVIHNGKSFACKVCEKSFSRKYYLKIHMRMHSDERLFACDICEKSFKRKEYLVKHYHVHSGTGEKPFECDICGKTFNWKFCFRLKGFSQTLQAKDFSLCVTE